MIINPVLVGIVGTLFVEMAIVIIRNSVIKKTGNKDATKSKTF